MIFTGKDFAEYCNTIFDNRDHWCYWYGTYGNICTLEKYKSKKKQYPKHYTNGRKSGYMEDIKEKRRCADCVGLIKVYFWTGGKYNSTPKYGSNNCPDKSANDMFALCKKTGTINTIPDIPGIVVWKSGHIGVYVGNGYTVEMKGFAYDCQKIKVSKGPWEKWGMLPDSMISYDNPPSDNNSTKVLVTGGSVYVRTAPNKDTGKGLGTVHKGDKLNFQDTIKDGWYLVEYKNTNGWISGKYSTLT